MAKFVDELLTGNLRFPDDNPDNPNNDLKLATEARLPQFLEAMKAVRETKDAAPKNSTQQGSIYFVYQTADRRGAQKADQMRFMVAEGLGKHCTKESLEVLMDACDVKLPRPIRFAAIIGLEWLSQGTEKEVRARAWVELQVLAEIDADNEVQGRAHQVLNNIRAKAAQFAPFEYRP